MDLFERRIKNANYDLYQYKNKIYRIELIDCQLYLADQNLDETIGKEKADNIRRFLINECENIGGCWRGKFYGSEEYRNQFCKYPLFKREEYEID